MSKQELIEVVAKVSDSKAQAARAVDTMLDAIKGALASGKKVSITGFGTFETRERKARVGRNPRTGEKINISASKYVGFKTGKALKDAVK